MVIQETEHLPQFIVKFTVIFHTAKTTINGTCKYNDMNNNINCEWIKQSNQKAEIVNWIKRTNSMQFTGDTLYSRTQIC